MTKRSEEKKCLREFIERTLREMGSEDARGFRPLVAHRSTSYELLERRGLIYRSTTCIPERCARRKHHGPTPSGDCTREGWLLSIRGRLAIAALRNGMTFELALWWATKCENRYTATTVIHERVSDDDQLMMIGADLPRPAQRRQGGRLGRLAANVPPPSAAERSIAGESERMTAAEILIGDAISRLHLARARMRAAEVEIRALRHQLAEETE
jgi:hypothetical protein